MTYSSEITDFLKFSNSMISILDVISYLNPQCNYLIPNVYASVIKCNNNTKDFTNSISFSEMRPIQSSCRGIFNGLIVSQTRVTNLNTFKLVSNHPVRTFIIPHRKNASQNRTISISNEYYRKPFPALSNYINVVNHGTTCDLVGSKEVISIIHNIDIQEFHLNKLNTDAQVRPMEIDLNTITLWKKELKEQLDLRKRLPVKQHKKNVKKLYSKMIHNRKIIISLSTKPSRLKYVSNIIKYFDIEKYNALVILNLPKKFGSTGIDYPKIPVSLSNNPRVVIRWLPEDMGPYSKILPTLKHLLYRATANKIGEENSRRNLYSKLFQVLKKIKIKCIYFFTFLFYFIYFSF